MFDKNKKKNQFFQKICQLSTLVFFSWFFEANNLLTAEWKQWSEEGNRLSKDKQEVTYLPAKKPSSLYSQDWILKIITWCLRNTPSVISHLNMECESISERGRLRMRTENRRTGSGGNISTCVWFFLSHLLMILILNAAHGRRNQHQWEQGCWSPVDA